MAISAKAVYAGGAGTSGQWINPNWDASSGSWRSGSGSAGGSSVQRTSGSLSALDDYFGRLQQITNNNNTWSAAQAQKQMDFQRQSAQEAMKFNHDEAELSRLWQERMSNTAHQREIKDLQAAGLNPVLSAMGGSGAPVTSGATASGYTSQGAKGDTDTSLAPALVSLLGSIMQSQASIANTATSAAAQERIAQLGANVDVFRQLSSNASAKEIAEMGNLNSWNIAQLQSATSVRVAGIQANAAVTSAQIHGMATQAAAQISGMYGLSIAQTNQVGNIITQWMGDQTKKYGFDLDSWTKIEINSANNDLQRELQSKGFEFDLALQEDRQSHEFNLAILNNVGDWIGLAITGGFQKWTFGNQKKTYNPFRR